MGSFETQFNVLGGADKPEAVAADVLVLPVFQEKKADKKEEKSGKGKSKSKSEDKEGPGFTWTAPLTALDKLLKGEIKATLEAEKFNGDHTRQRVFYTGNKTGIAARWVVVIGMGLPDKLDMKKAIAIFDGSLRHGFHYRDVNHGAVILPGATKKVSQDQMAQAVVFGATESTYKTAEAGKDKIHKLKTVDIILSKPQKPIADLVKQARIMGQAEAFAKDLCNMPANIKRAQTLADAAVKLADSTSLDVSVISDAKKIQRDMPAFWAVAQGAAETDPPRFIHLTYKPKGKIKKRIALVGKGVIFDTGGVQVKPGSFMDDMKFDMTGAATVMGTIKAAAEMKLEGIEVHAYVAATQNLTGETAYLPDSIIDSASGRKIEIRHTDAEGRVTLADAVHKALQDKPDEMVTIATLTGAASAAVGFCIALMGTDDKLVQRLDKCCKGMGERCQPLELLEEDFEANKSKRDAADIANVSRNKYRGHMSAGAFVISFAEDVPIAHMDIAGGDAKDGNSTGIAVKGMINYLIQEAARA